MYQTIRVKLLNLLLSLSDALDLASPQLSQHQLRTAFIAWEIGRMAGLTADEENHLFIAALLHDVGALSPEEKLEIRQIEIDNPQPHTILGEKLLQRVPQFVTASRIVRRHHTQWTDLAASDPPAVRRAAQILYLADTVERAIDRQKFILHQAPEVTAYIRSLAGTELQPEIVDIFQEISVREDFWLDLISQRLYSVLLHNGPCQACEIEVSQLLTISEMFRDMIDFRSRFTSTHSSGVAAAAATLSRLFGFTETEVELMEVAGNLHDLGKMAIPNRILAKPGKLTTEEFAVMRQHTYYTYTILNTIGRIQHIAEWAAFHHERLDGSGYPFHLSANQLSVNARIMAVADVFTALTEDRPYRASLSQKEVLATLQSLGSRRWLDQSIVGLLEKNHDEVTGILHERQAMTRLYYEAEFSDPVAVSV